MSPFRPLSRRFGLLTAAATVAMLAVSLAAPAASFAEPPIGTTVTVTILGQDNQPLVGADTQLTSQSPYVFLPSSSETDSSGSYTFDDVSPGTYALSVQGSDGTDYVPSTTTSVTVGTDPVAVTQQFVAPSSISGTISGVDGADMTGADVGVYTTDGDWVTSADVSDAQGDYTVDGLSPGDYTLEFEGPFGSSYIPQWWDGETDSALGDIVTLGVSTAVTGYDANLQLPPPLATISGKVTGSDDPGVGLAGISIFYYDSVGDFPGEATTGSDGTYSIPVSPGTYVLDFQDRTGSNYLEQFYDNKATQDSATPITVGTTDVTDQDTVLVLGGSLSGTITDASTGLPISDATVYLHSLVGVVAAATTTDADGYYVVNNIPLGSYYARYDVENGNGIAIDYATQYWNDHASQADSDPVTFAGGTEITDQDVALTPLFTTTTKPTISGTAAVGQTLTASTADWTPTTDGISYQWQRGGVDIAGATDPSYTVVNADGGSKLTVTATGTRTGYATASTTSTSTATVTGAAFVSATPTISGTAVVGQRLTVATGTWSPQPSFSYSWKRGTTQVGTSSSYTPVAADIGQSLTVTVTGSKTSVTSASQTSAPTDAVVAGTLTSTPVPTVTGTPTVGQTLRTTVSSNAWQPSRVTLGYQWSRDGVAIGGATSNSYTLTNGDAGAKLTVTVTGTESGYTTVAETSLPTAMVTGGTLTTPAPTITGIATVGDVLDSSVGSWLPAPVTLSYQWNRDGTAIGGATDSSYELTAADVGSTITLSVTGSRDGFGSATTTSLATTAVANGVFTTPTPTVTGVAQVGELLTVNAGFTPSPDAVSYQWSADGTPIAGATGSSFTVTAAELGKQIVVEATATRNGYTPATVTTTPTDAVIAAPTTTVSTGDAVQGSTITVTGAGFLSSPSYDLELHSTPVLLGTVTPNANGSFTTRVTIPMNTAPGTHHIVIVDPSGTEFASIEISVAAHAQTLAFTGTTLSLGTGTAGLGVLLFGLVLVLIRRRRQTS